MFELSRFLQVQEVTVEGKPLEFVQNDALEGSELARRGNDLVAVVFPTALAPNHLVRLRFVYRGEVLSEAGGGLMYVGARGIWYPNRGLAMADFDMEFRYPQPWTLVATGKRVPPTALHAAADSSTEQVARFVTERPIALAGFNLGQYAKAEATVGSVGVQTYAARSVEDTFPRQRSTIIADERVDPWTGRRLGAVQVLPESLPEPSQHGRELAERAALIVDFFSARFGPFPYGTLALAQMPGTSSQGWPGMVYLSSFAFLTAEERKRSHMGPYEDALFGRLMLGHEIAHQWWGDLLLWKSYREQWLIEALSNYSMMLMIEQEDPAVFRTIMEEYRRELLKENKDGRPMADAGPVTLGVRLNSSRFPDAYEYVAYGRGTWLFHMLRHMLADNVSARRGPAGRAGADDPFIVVLRGLRERFEGKSITTRDVQQAFEDALPDSLRYESRKSLEWFFDGWVNGTAIPSLELTGVKLARRGGGIGASGRIRQKHAPRDLVTSVPIYAETGSGQPVLLGRVFVEGEETPFRFTAPAGTRKLLLDPYQTVLTRP
jgi:hypothetical protein